jgi:hypothetical protein
MAESGIMEPNVLDIPRKKVQSVHGSRTMMFLELDRVMAHGLESGNFLHAMNENVFGKQSASGIQKTKGYLRRLYKLDPEDNAFRAFNYFWKMADLEERPLLALIYAIGQDDLLAESIPVMAKVRLGEKAAVELFEEELEKRHSGDYSANTLRSTAQNIASSWKQAGFLEGKVRNIRIQPAISPKVVCFAFLLAFLRGLRGDFILKSTEVKALGLGESALRELALEAKRLGLLDYQYAGGITSVHFHHLLNQIGIDVEQS